MYAIYTIDLRDLAAELDTLTAKTELEGFEQERLTAIQELDDQLFCDLAEYAGNAPVMVEVASFEDYAREYAADIGAINDEFSWPANCIDWEKAAAELRMDFNEVTFEGTKWLVRSY